MYQKVCMLSFLGYFIILYDVNASDVWYFVVTLSPGGIHTQVEKKAKVFVDTVRARFGYTTDSNPSTVTVFNRAARRCLLDRQCARSWR